MESQAITSFSLSEPPKSIQDWCDRWNKRAFKAGVARTKLFGRTIGRPNILRPSYQIALLRIGEMPLTFPFRGTPIESITDEVLRSATKELMTQAGITTVFEF